MILDSFFFFFGFSNLYPPPQYLSNLKNQKPTAHLSLNFVSFFFSIINRNSYKRNERTNEETWVVDKQVVCFVFMWDCSAVKQKNESFEEESSDHRRRNNTQNTLTVCVWKYKEKENYQRGRYARESIKDWSFLNCIVLGSGEERSMKNWRFFCQEEKFKNWVPMRQCIEGGVRGFVFSKWVAYYCVYHHDKETSYYQLINVWLGLRFTLFLSSTGRSKPRLFKRAFITVIVIPQAAALS